MIGIIAIAVLAAIVGACFGIGIMCLCVISKHSGEKRE